MLELTIPQTEYWDEKKEEFIYKKELKIQLEHSLVSISKWESKWNKAFLGKQEKTNEEIIDYIRCMTITKNVPEEAYYRLSNDNYETINSYIESPMTATTFYNHDTGKPNNKTITSELIYYWMIAYNIPVKFETWHLNRLLTLIRICDLKNTQPKKIPKSELAKRNAALNAARRNKIGSKG